MKTIGLAMLALCLALSLGACSSGSKDEKKAPKTFSEVDRDQDGKIILEELVFAFPGQNAADRFRFHDKQGKGWLDEAQYQEFLASLSSPLPKNQPAPQPAPAPAVAEPVLQEPPAVEAAPAVPPKPEHPAKPQVQPEHPAKTPAKPEHPAKVQAKPEHPAKPQTQKPVAQPQKSKPQGAAESGKPVAAKPQQPRIYSVAKGDTLYSIAKRFKISVAQLRQANAQIDSSQLKPGKTLAIPKP